MLGEFKITGSMEYHKKTYSTEDMLRYVSYIKNLLRENGLVAGDAIVGIMLTRSPYMIASMIAVLESGLSFMLIDLAMPKERVLYMLKDAGIEYSITIKDAGIPYDNFCKMIPLDEIEDTKASVNIKSFEQKLNVEEMGAYLIYTSGTTGNPKGVELRRIGVINFIHGVSELIPALKNKRIVSLTNCSFDIFILETVFAMYNAMTIIMADEEQKDNPRKTIELIMESHIDVLQTTPSRLKMIRALDSKLHCLQNLSTLLIGGEKFPEDILPELKENLSATIYNMYGPTETTVWSSICNVSEEPNVHIGKPIGNTRIYLLDKEHNFVKKPEEQGEICIAGDGLAKGYHNNSELTKKAFITLSLPDKERIYRTGDLGKRDSNGNIYCLGRIDEQVKVRGYRVELSEIDANIEKMQEVTASVTCYIEEEEQLETFYIASCDVDIRKSIKEFFPSYMIPAHFTRVEKLLYTSSGKMDRKAMIREYYNNNTSKTDIVEQEDQVAKEVVEIIKNKTNANGPIHEEDGLESIGIDSLNFVLLVVDIEEAFDIEFDDEYLIMDAFHTVRDIISYIRTKSEE